MPKEKNQPDTQTMGLLERMNNKLFSLYLLLHLHAKKKIPQIGGKAITIDTTHSDQKDAF